MVRRKMPDAVFLMEGKSKGEEARKSYVFVGVLETSVGVPRIGRGEGDKFYFGKTNSNCQ